MNDLMEGDRYARIVFQLHRLFATKVAALQSQGYTCDGSAGAAASADAVRVLHMVHDAIVHVAGVEEEATLEATTELMLGGNPAVSDLGTDRRPEQ